MEMRYFWVADQVENKIIDVSWHPGAECLADYPSKAHPPSHHQKVQPFYQHEDTSPRVLPQAPASRTMRGCVGTNNGYLHGKSPLLDPTSIVPPGTVAATACAIHQATQALACMAKSINFVDRLIS